MNKRIFTLIFAVFALHAYAQQEAQFSHYMFLHPAYNPGYLGLDDAICLNGDHRQQWMGLEGVDKEGNAVSISPVTSFFSIDAAVHPIYGGIGLNFQQDQIGAFTNTMVQLGYSYHRNIGPGKLGLGLMGGMMDQKIDFSYFKPNQPNDPLLMGNQESDMVFDLSFGAFYRVTDMWYAGLSSSRIIESTVDIDVQGNPDVADYKLRRHYYLTGGYFFRLPHPDFMLQPTLLVKSDIAATQYDISTLVWYRNRFYGGLTYRPTDAVSVLVGMRGIIGGEQSLLGVSYDVTTSPLGAMGRSAGTFEIYMKYCFNIEIPKELDSHETVRFL